jgi:hypothetical protein
MFLQAMVSLRLKVVVEDVDRHGNVRIYFRRPGQAKIWLSGLPGSEEFQTAYAAALAKTQAGRPRPRHRRLNVDRWRGCA